MVAKLQSPLSPRVLWHCATLCTFMAFGPGYIWSFPIDTDKISLGFVCHMVDVTESSQSSNVSYKLDMLLAPIKA